MVQPLAVGSLQHYNQASCPHPIHSHSNICMDHWIHVNEVIYICIIIFCSCKPGSLTLKSNVSQQHKL